MNRRIFLFFTLVFAFHLAFGSEVTGRWKTIDDTTGEIKSIVEITEVNGKVYGKIIKLFNADPNFDPVCTECKDHLRGKKIIGMQIINGLTLDNGRWGGSKGVLDPDNGKYYDVKIWLDEKDPSKLNVRGYISFLFRTQTWLREY
jgi:uncharacterized protein (DUF2147 family)